MPPEALGRPKRLTLHWSAGQYDQTFDDYHGCILGDGRRVQTLPLTVKGAHTWGRNSGNIGEAFCAMADGCPVTPQQIETMACTVAEHCHRWGIALKGQVRMPKMHVQGQSLVVVPGQFIWVPTVTDHAWYARADGYYPARWDIGELLEPVLRKAAWYLQQLYAGKRGYEHTRGH